MIRSAAVEALVRRAPLQRVHGGTLDGCLVRMPDPATVRIPGGRYVYIAELDVWQWEVDCRG